MFGFCLTKDHDSCPERIQRWYWEQKRGKQIRVTLDEYNICNCKCHD